MEANLRVLGLKIFRNWGQPRSILRTCLDPEERKSSVFDSLERLHHYGTLLRSHCLKTRFPAIGDT